MRNRPVLTQALAIVFAASAINCGGSSFTGSASGGTGGTESAGGSGNAGPPLSQIPQLYALAMCNALEHCSSVTAGLFLGANDCTTLIAAQIRNASLPGIQAAVDAGTANYDPSATQACTDAVTALGCQYSNNPFVPACEQALGGTLDAGAACSIDEECKGDLYCKYSGACPGVCAEREAVEGLCRTNSDCQSGLTCFITDNTAGRCTLKPTLGQECGMDLPSDCAPQSGDSVVCWGADDTKRGTCVAINSIASRAIGAECGVLTSSLCVAGASCQLASIALNGTCVAASSTASGCAFAFPDPCAKDQYCTSTAPNAAGVCSLLPTEGQACLTGIIQLYSNKVCAADHLCLDGTCTKYRQNGEPCTTDKICYSGRCDSQSQKCVAKQNCAPAAM